jgi:hypothetical protein
MFLSLASVMNPSKMKDYKEVDLQDIPLRLSEPEVVYALRNRDVDGCYLMSLKDQGGVSGEALSRWLHITPKTLRSYMKLESPLGENLKEQVLLLASLFRHGAEVFASPEGFIRWLHAPNFYLDGSAPETFLNTVSGIRFVDDRLYGLEFGDNA